MTIIVPYRDRPDHLAQFIPHMREYLPEAGIVVVEQAPGKPFNRARLLNIGYLLSRPMYFCMHDVDMLPVKVDYSPRIGATQLAKSDIQKVGYMGGVTMFDAATFEFLGGYHNDYFHRAEDNCLWFNLQRLNIKVLNRFGLFKELPHKRSGPEFIPELWKKAQQPREIQDQLSVCEYEVVDRQEFDTHTHIVVEI
jgi:hypothetical protein